jgi:hypothetical protein
MLTAQEIAATLRMHAATAVRRRVEGVGPAYFKIGPLHRYPPWKLERWFVTVVWKLRPRHELEASSAWRAADRRR